MFPIIGLIKSVHQASPELLAPGTLQQCVAQDRCEAAICLKEGSTLETQSHEVDVLEIELWLHWRNEGTCREDHHYKVTELAFKEPSQEISLGSSCSHSNDAKQRSQSN